MSDVKATENPSEERGASRKSPRRDWEAAIEKQIREAMERGDFDELPGRGKPQELWQDPNVPADWQLAFKVLKDAGYAPDWIEQDKEIRAELEKLFAPFKRYLEREHARWGDRARREARLIEEFRHKAVELNRVIDIFNLKAPTPRVHHRRIRIEEEVERFRAACAHLA